jgi:DNA-binding MarR family transcriptional regulator
MLYIPKKILSNYQLTYTDKVLWAIFSDNPTITNREIGSKAGIGPNAITRSLKRLEHFGFVAIDPSRRNGDYLGK